MTAARYVARVSYASNPDKLNVPWFQSPFFESLLQELPLDAETRAAVEAYARDGYLVFDPEIPNADAVFSRMIRDLAPRYEGVGRIQDAWTTNADVRQLAIQSKVLSLLRTLYRREPIPFQTLNFPVGTQQAAHSDSIHFAT